MKISIKLSVSEIYSLCDLMERTLEFDCGNYTRVDAITNMVLLKFFQKIKLKSVFVEKPFKVKFEEETALAFVHFYTSNAFLMTDFEGNLMSKLLAFLDKKTAFFFNYY